MKCASILTVVVWAGVCSAYETKPTAFATIVINKEDETCKPGTSWWDDCNACRCAPDRTIRCTKLNCSEYRNALSQNDMAPPSAQEELCQCSDGSFRRCVNGGCPVVIPEQPPVKHPFSPPGFHCSCQGGVCTTSIVSVKIIPQPLALKDMPFTGNDNLRKQELCQCPDGSYSRCVNGGCPGVIPDQTSVKTPSYPERRQCCCQSGLCATRRCATPPVNLRRARCTPGSSFQNECNTCKCNMDGESVTCSNYTCAKKSEDKRRIWVSCVPGNVFKTRCYICQCEDSGKIAVCTMNSCETIN